MDRNRLRPSAPRLTFFLALSSAVVFTASAPAPPLPDRTVTAIVQRPPRALADVKDLGIGKLLVARRGLGDGNFAESVVLLFAYGAKDGAAGVIVNRKTTTLARRLIPDINYGGDADPTLFFGGPVEPTAVRGLVRSRFMVAGVVRVLPDVLLLTSRTALDKAFEEGTTADQLRLYAGYAGWGPGQLEREVERGDWYISPGDSSVVFATDPERVWRRQIELSDVIAL